MFVKLIFQFEQSIARPGDESPRDHFWRTMRAKAHNQYKESDKTLVSYDPVVILSTDKLEKMVRDDLPKELSLKIDPHVREFALNKQPKRRGYWPWGTLTENKKTISSTGEQSVEIKTLVLNYGSLETVLQVIGLGPYAPIVEAFAPTLTSLLAGYAPLALTNALYASDSASDPFGFRVTAEQIDNNQSTSDAPEPSRISDSISSTWILANTSLLLPVGLALAVCWFTQIAENEREVRLETARNALLADRQALVSEALQALKDQTKDAHEAAAAMANIAETQITKAVEAQGKLAQQASDLLRDAIKDRTENDKAFLQLSTANQRAKREDQSDASKIRIP